MMRETKFVFNALTKSFVGEEGASKGPTHQSLPLQSNTKRGLRPSSCGTQDLGSKA